MQPIKFRFYKNGTLAFTIAAGSLLGCNPIYVMEAAFHEGRILLNRRDIGKVIAEQQVTPSEVESLRLVSEARIYAQTRGLTAGGVFTTFSPTNDDSLVWVVMGCKPDSFTAKQWWFPIVGSVPYKGFFEKSDAVAEARDLDAEGYETFVRGSSAFSTLGWFDDPVLTPLLKSPYEIVVNTVIHELVHRSLWVPGNTPFNESLANFIGYAETVKFFKDRKSADTPKYYAAAAQRFAREIALSQLTENLYHRLKKIYESSESRDQKLRQKREAFASIQLQARNFGINTQLFHRANNAEFLQLFIYTRKLNLFNTLYQREQADLSRFLKKIVEFISFLDTRDRSDEDIFDSLERFMHTSSKEG
jgi:predicted aminopeptidase